MDLVWRQGGGLQPPGTLQRSEFVRVQIVHHQNDCGKWMSTRSRRQWASTMVRRAVTLTEACSGANRRKRLLVPLRSYSSHIWPLTRSRWQGQIFGQLFTAFIKTDHRSLGILLTMIDLKRIFHADELCTRCLRNAPRIFQPGLKFVFLSVVRTVSREIRSRPAYRPATAASTAPVHPAQRYMLTAPTGLRRRHPIRVVVSVSVACG